MAASSVTSDPLERVEALASGTANGKPSLGTLNPLDLAVSRWPQVVVGLCFGLIFGLAYHVQKSPKYESISQVLVLKRSAEAVNRNDSRIAQVEDYVATQVTLLRSEQILLAAARSLNTAEVREELPDSDRGKAALFALNLSVSRERDGSSILPTGGSGVLNLAYRSEDPFDSQVILQTVIRAYQAELSSIYDEATRTRMKTLDELIRARQRERETTLALLGEKSDELRQITEEEVQNIRLRVSARRDKELSLELDLVDFARQVELIEAAGSDRSKRLAALAQLTTPSGRMDRIDPNNPLTQIQLLQAKLEELMTRLGKDHPDVKSLVGQIQFYRQAYARLNPRGQDGEEELDELWALELRLKQQKATLEDQLKRIQAQLRADRETLIAAGRLQDQITRLMNKADDDENDILEWKKELVEIDATQAFGGYQARVITEAAPGRKVSPVLFQSLLLGLVLGGFFGAGLAALAELSDQGFGSAADVRKRLQLPVLGMLPRIELTASPDSSTSTELDLKLVTVHKPTSREAEAYRGLRTQLLYLSQAGGLKVIQVTSPNPGDGKSTLAANLACSIAQSGKRTLLIDCDLRKPRLHQIFRTEVGRSGVATLLETGGVDPPMTRPSGVTNLDLLTSGPRPVNPAELLAQVGLSRLIDQLRSDYDLVVLDTPPLLAVSDPAIIAGQVDGVIMALRLSSRVRPAAERACELLHGIGANLLGVVINGVNTKRDAEYEYSYAYAESYAEPDFEADRQPDRRQG